MIGDLLPVLFVLTRILLVVVAIVFFVSGLDDLFIDVVYGLRLLYRRLFVREQPLTEEHLHLPPEKPIAVLIPAWQESQVIGGMLENLFASVHYGDVHVFVGTYPNDPATGREVERVRERFPNLHRVVCPKSGPTNKADCLNWVYQGVMLFEKQQGVRFEIFVNHDAEDIPHPLSLKFFNYLIPQRDMVQLPVFALERPWSYFTGNHYMDEFAETHTKDLTVRERLAGSIPSAGVGCGFSRRAFERLAEASQNQLFNVGSLTEDYDLGLRLGALGARSIFARAWIERTAARPHPLTGSVREVKEREYIATREFFPATLREAVRQKGRWVLGIVFQGWGNLGWRGTLAQKYMLARDRKTVITAQINILGYLVLAIVLAYALSVWLYPDSYRYPPLVERDSWLWKIIVADTTFLVLRLVERLVVVWRIYGWQQGLLSVPRVVWGNWINFLATSRATGIFIRSRMSGRPVAWDHTAHAFPTGEELRTFRRRLGDLLLEKRFLKVGELEAALARQKNDPRPLGAILVEMGLVDGEQVVQALGQQLNLAYSEIDPYAVPLELLELVPHAVAVAFGVFPLEMRGGRLVLASNERLEPEELATLRETLGRPIELALSTQSDVCFAIRRGYDRLAEMQRRGGEPRRLGERLLERGLLDEAGLRRALKAQREAYVRIGDLLVEQGKITRAALEETVARQALREPHVPLGTLLVQEGRIAIEDLESALELQRRRVPRLGDVLVDQGLVRRSDLEAVLKESGA